MAKVGDIGWFWSGYAPKTLGVISKIVELETFSYFYAEGLANSYMNFEPMTDEELAGLGLVRKEKLDKAKECLEYISDGEVRYLDMLNCYNTKQATKKELKEFARQALKEMRGDVR